MLELHQGTTHLKCAWPYCGSVVFPLAVVLDQQPASPGDQGCGTRARSLVRAARSESCHLGLGRRFPSAGRRI